VQIQSPDQVIQKALAVDLNIILDFYPNPQLRHLLIANQHASKKYFRL